MIAFALTAGVLLMTFAIPPIDALAADASPVLADFSTNEGNPGWYVVNDNVMGGRSEGGFTIDEGELRFAGREVGASGWRLARSADRAKRTTSRLPWNTVSTATSPGKFATPPASYWR